jgi:hypothetical protein
MKNMSETARQPKSDFGKCVGEQCELFLADADGLKPLGLPGEGGRLEGRLVGVDRPGLWFEPKAWLDQALAAEQPVRHVFIKWENVLGLTRAIESEKFEQKKEYRGLRPRP